MWLIDPCLVARFGAALVSELMKLASNCRAAFEGQSNQETEREALEAAIAKVAAPPIRFRLMQQKAIEKMRDLRVALRA